MMLFIALLLIVAGLPVPRGNRGFSDFLRCDRGDLGSILGIGGSLLGASSASDAANAQAASAQAATQAQLGMFGQNMTNQMPWLSTGAGAAEQLAYLMGVTPIYPQVNSSLQPYVPGSAPPPAAPAPNAGGHHGGNNGGGAPAPAPVAPGTNGFTSPLFPNGTPVGSVPGGGFGSLAANPTSQQILTQLDPGYNFDLQQGTQALQRQQAAMGGAVSGAALKGMQQYSQGLASNEFANAYGRYTNNQTNLYNRLAGIAGTGQTSAGNLGAQGTTAAGNAANSMLAGGAANAAGIMGQNNAFQQGLQYLGTGLNNWMGNSGGGGVGPSGGGWNWGPVTSY